MSERASRISGELEGLLRELTGEEFIAQAVVAVESGDRSFRWVGVEGATASGDPVTEDTPFLIASIDELYNATITLMLSEEGRLDLDDPIAAYLPPRAGHLSRG